MLFESEGLLLYPSLILYETKKEDAIFRIPLSN